MKKRLILFAMLLGLTALASCTKEIKFRGSESEPRLVLYSLARAGEPLEVEVSESVFFLNSESGKAFVSDLDVTAGTVKLYVNGGSVPYSLTRREPQKIDVDGDGIPDYEDLPAAPLYYDAPYAPKGGDRLRIEADFPGFDPVSAEITVPVCTSLTVDSVTEKEGVASYWGTTHICEMTLTIKRGADPSCYYAITPCLRSTDPDNGEIYLSTLTLESDDYIFQGNGTQDQINQLLSDDSVDKVFADTMLPSDTYTFRCRFEMPDLQFYRDEGVSIDVYLLFTTMGRDLYYYRVSRSQVGYTSFGFLSEATELYSNVVGGYGCFCARSSVEIPLGL